MDNDIPAKKIETKAKGFLLIILFANFIRYVEISIIDIGLPNFVIDLAGTLSLYGLVVGIFALTRSIFQVPIAIASDKIGRKIMMVISIIIYTIGTFLCFIAENIVQLLIYRSIQGMGAYSSILQAMIGDYYRKKHGKGMAIYSFTITLGFFAGFIIGGLFLVLFGPRSIFLIAGILGLISVVIVIIFLKMPQQSISTSQIEQKEGILKQSIKISDVKIILKENQYKIILIVNAFRWLLFFGIYAYIIWMIEIYYKVPHIETIILLIIIVLLYALFIVLGGILADHIGPRKTIIIGQVLVISFGFLFFIITGLIVFIIVNIIVSVGFALVETGGNAYLSKILEEKYPHVKGSGFGFNNALGFFCSAIGPIILCYLGEFHVFLPYYVVSIIIIGALLITIKFIKS
ncbi:MAG: MFS transporter [Promethearchaeota archaeon]|nr:MAG: MFS transporter [Candidatus Lokiarchaeota archaeon]